MSISTPDARPGRTRSADGHVDCINVNRVCDGLDAADPPKRHTLGGDGARRVKHAADRVIALAALVILAPLLVVIAIAVRLSSPGQALFAHERIGANGRPFRMWKFRSMKAGAEDQLAGLLRMHGRDNEPLFKVPDDPRVTRLGHWLRRWSLDELPQLWNVVLGQMSLVGPRPQVGAEVMLYGERERERLRVRPGLTGLWQVSGRSRLAWQKAILLDLYYVKNWSLLMDLWILARTLRAVLNGRGAS
jgi:lipopolysaccharide/colanic/teichoic acid biosynthesis glycosyltransferase